MSRINCFHRWEQAFRMDATIYCSKHPNRSREIWQYILVINTASMSYTWENVYNYDMIFRQWMELNPARSRAVTYNQMWNLSMTTPILTNNSRRNSFGGFGGQTNQYRVSNANGTRRKNDYCWSFSRGSKCNCGKKYKFVERCSYCDSPYHGLVNCEKLDKKEKDSAIAGMNKISKTPPK